MSDKIDKIIDVTIQRQTQVPSEESFSELLVVSEFLTTDVTPEMTERVRVYGALSDIGDGFGTDHPVYIACQSALMQDPSLKQIYVGRKKTGADGSETYADALNEIKAEDNSWYGLTCITRELADQQAIATWVEANKKLCGLASADANIVDGTGDIAEYLKTNNLERTFVIYHPLSNATAGDKGTDQFPEMALMGKMFPADNVPGQSNWAHKTLAGVSAYSLSVAQYNTAIGKNCNIYQIVGGLSKTLFGTTGAEGTFIDLVWGTDWLESHIQTLVYTPLASLPKVGFTNAGIQTIVGQLKKAVQDGVDAGILASDPAPIFDFPLAKDVSPQDKANRHLPNIFFTATLSGAINSTKISGTLVL